LFDVVPSRGQQVKLKHGTHKVVKRGVVIHDAHGFVGGGKRGEIGLEVMVVCPRGEETEWSGKIKNL